MSRVLCIRARALGSRRGRQTFTQVTARPACPTSGRVGALVRFPPRWVLRLVFSRVHAPTYCLRPPWAPRPPPAALGTRLLPRGCRGVKAAKTLSRVGTLKLRSPPALTPSVHPIQPLLPPSFIHNINSERTRRASLLLTRFAAVSCDKNPTLIPDSESRIYNSILI